MTGNGVEISSVPNGTSWKPPPVGGRAASLDQFTNNRVTNRFRPAKFVNIGQEKANETTIDDLRRRCRIGLQRGATVGTVGAALSIGMLHGYFGELLVCHAPLQWRRVDRGRPTRASLDGVVPTVGHP